MSDKVRAQAINIDTEALVDLFELDTTRLTNVHGITGTGDIYRWTPGLMNYRDEGVIVQPGGSLTIVWLDRVVPILANTAQTWVFSFAMASGAYSPPALIAGHATVNGVSTLAFASPLPEEPLLGAVWYIQSEGSVFMGGVEYRPVPVEAIGMEWSGTGKLPRPRLRVSNIGGLPTALVAEFGDIVGATVTRIRTFRNYLDGEPEADPSAIADPEVFTVDRKSRHDKNEIEWELAPEMDQQGIMIPKRVVIRDTCDHTYRKWITTGWAYGSCPYRDERYYTMAAQQAFSPNLDRCGKHMTDCKIRFGDTVRLPMQAFPGISEYSI